MVVVQTMSGCDMNKPGAGHVFDKTIACVEMAGAFAERMLIFQLAQVASIEAAHDLIAIPTAFRGDGREEQSRNNQLFFSYLHQRIAERRVIRHRQVGRERPRRGGPNYDGGFRMAQQRELYVNALADMIFI